MSYQKLNQFTCPFTFPIPRCDGAVQDINPEANYFIAVDKYSGYQQVVEEEEVCVILTFFSLGVKWRWKVIPMRDLNAALTFVAMTTKLQMEYGTLSKERVTVWEHSLAEVIIIM